MQLAEYIRNIPDYPKKGIQFKDVTSLMAEPDAFKYAVDKMAEKASPFKPTTIIGIESRGFIFGSAMAYKLGLRFVPIRKKGKLPAKTISVSYDLEYGSDTLEIHEDALTNNDRVVVVDDLIATGGTALAAAKLVEQLGAELVAFAFLADLPYLGGSKKIKRQSFDQFSLISYDGE